MDPIDWWQDGTSIYAAVVATGAAALEVRRWFETGARLSISIMCPAIQFGGAKDDLEYVAVNVSNRGDVPTSITHFSVYEYPNWWARFRRKASWAGIVAKQSNPQLDLPYEVAPGKYWLGMVKHEGKLKKAAQQGTLYVGISAVHYSKTILVKVRPSKDRALAEAKAK